MPTKRTAVSRYRKVVITPEIIALYRAALGAFTLDCDNGESLALDEALGRKVWQKTILGTVGQDEPPTEISARGPDRVEDWLNAYKLRLELEAATTTDDEPPYVRPAPDQTQLEQWREWYDKANEPGYAYGIGHAKKGDTFASWLEGDAAKQATYQWAKIPETLIQKWDAKL